MAPSPAHTPAAAVSLLPTPANQAVRALEKDLADFEATRGEWMRRIALNIGKLQQRFGNNAVGRFVLKHFTTRIIAGMIVRLRVLGVGTTAPQSARDLVYDWLKLAKFFHAPVEVQSMTPHQVVVCHHECTMGFRPGQGKLCRASMNMDVQIIRRLGGKMTIEHTLAEGADHCRHVIEFPAPRAEVGATR
ncbi:MAG: hypothetical protein HYT87_15585 [Nitrospirae bacterium]|nr:hypothetical protein [Nitrospirota bacterium]